MAIIEQGLAQLAAELALEKKAIEVKILDLREISEITDFFVICSGESDTQLRAISEHLEFQLKSKYDSRPWHIEGYKGAQWILMDYIDVVIHIFLPEKRLYYGLELLWGDAPVMSVEDEINSA